MMLNLVKSVTPEKPAPESSPFQLNRDAIRKIGRAKSVLGKMAPATATNAMASGHVNIFKGMADTKE